MLGQDPLQDNSVIMQFGVINGVLLLRNCSGPCDPVRGQLNDSSMSYMESGYVLSVVGLPNAPGHCRTSRLFLESDVSRGSKSARLLSFGFSWWYKFRTEHIAAMAAIRSTEASAEWPARKLKPRQQAPHNSPMAN